MGRITSAARSTIHTAGKHLPLSSVSSAQNAANSNATTSTGRRFLCCARANNKAPQREHDVQTPKLEFDRVEMSRKMKDIIEQLKPLCAKVSTILNLELLAANLNNDNGQRMATGRPITTSDSIEPELYGRKDVTSPLIDDITKGKYHDMDDLTVLPIVGPGGIGKTTLTQHIYKEVKDHFEVKLWVCVPGNFNVSRFTQEIANKLSNKENASPESRIEEGLKSKRFLLVLDDIWRCSNEDEWNRFLVPFKKGQTKGSVILVTTRFLAVAQIMIKPTDHWIDLKGIDEEAFRELFFAYVFGNKQPPEDHSELLGIGDEIIKKLKGSPLAAKTVGRLLRDHPDLGVWTRVLESREWESRSGDNDIMPALKLSFDYLPFHLQQCFAYCSLFPEDYKFGEEEIIHFWIGLDVLHSRGENKKVEDIGRSYLIELINHGFFKKEQDDGGRTYYVIHDLMHELGLKVSADECLSLNSANMRSIQILPSIRHLSINIDDSSFMDRKAFDTCKKDFSVLGEILRVENLHSLMLFGKHQGSFAKNLHGLFSKAKSLRAILVSGDFYSMEDLLHSFSELIHLRYLRVHENYWSYQEKDKLIASNSISRFYLMRVLDLRGCRDFQNLPSYMSNLVKLRHFLVGQRTSVHSGISEVGKLKSLQELKRFKVGKESEGFELSQIGHLLDLCGSLEIDNLENVEGREGADEAKLMHKKNLNELILNWNVKESNTDPAREEQVLEGLKPHSNLKKLSIRGHGGGTCPSWLGLNLSVQNLESLCLDGVDWETFPPIVGELQLVNKVAEETPSNNSPRQHFINLKRIELANLERLQRWVVGNSSGQLLSHLEVLIIRGCPELVELQLVNSPSQLLKNLKRIELARLERLERWVIGSNGQLSHLESLEITRCPELVELQFLDCNHSQQDLKTWAPNLRSLEIQDCPKLWSLPPIPWTRSLCNVEISGVGLGFEKLSYAKFYIFPLTLSITGNKDTQDSASFWTSLDFDNLTEVKELRMDACPPLPLDGLQKMSSLKDLNIENCNDPFGPVEDAGYQFAVERMHIFTAGATSGKELTRVLSCMPKLSGLTIIRCGKITGLGVVQQQEEEEQREEEEEIEEAEEGLLLLPRQLHELWITACPVRLQTRLCSLGLRSLSIVSCPKFLSRYAPSSSSSCFPFPTSLQSLYLNHVDKCGGDLGLGRLLAHGCCVQELTVLGSTDFFSTSPDSISSRLLSSLTTDDVAGALAAPICSLLSSSLTKLQLEISEMECFTVEQDGALQLLTSLQHLQFSWGKKLQSLPAGLHRLTSLKTLEIKFCPSIRLLPGLPKFLEKLTIYECSEIHTLSKESLPNSLQELNISRCPSIRSLPKPKAGLPTSLKLIDVSDYYSYREDGNSEELKRQCRNLIGSIPIVRAYD